MKTNKSNKGKVRACGLKHKHNYFDCCAACVHGEHLSEGSSGHVKTCKYYKSMTKQIKKECKLCEILENPQYAFSPVVLKERIKGLSHTCQPPQQPVENKGWEEFFKKYFRHMGDNLWAFNPEEEKSPYFSDNLYKDISLLSLQRIQERDLLIEKIEGMKRPTIKGGLEEAIKILKSEEKIGQHMINSWYNQALDDILSILKQEERK